MADWTFATGNALTRKAWAKKWWMEAKTESYFYENGFVGKSNSNIVVEFPDLEKEQGDVITYGQLRELSGAGVANDSQMEGAEEAPLTYDDTLTLTQIRNAIRTAGRETEMRPSDNSIREYASELLKRWMAAQIDQAIFTAVESSATKTIYGGDATTTATIEAGDYMTLSLISKCVAYARKANPLIIGPNVKGKPMNGVIVMSPDQAFDLSERDAAWAQAQREAQRRGADNPIFTGALGIHKNVPIHEHPRVATTAVWGTSSNLNGAQASFMGCQCAAIAYSKRKIWEEKTFDFGNKAGFCIGAIYGISKSVFNSADNAYVAVDTYRTSN
ncbi:MAG: N4-gp56 family major capsid protein [Victivallales bacterium]|jgi:N4-gp56 family major capsid protein